MDRFEAIERLSKLKDDGVLTETEFTQQKSLVLSGAAVALSPAPQAFTHNTLRPSYTAETPAYIPGPAPSPQIHIHNVNAQHNPPPHIYLSRTQKSVFLAYVMWLFLGGIGGHRFYLGRTGTGVCQLLIALLGAGAVQDLSTVAVGLFLIGFLGLWLFVDLFLIPGMADQRNRQIYMV